MNYIYYPGCSLEGTAKEYNISVRKMFEALGHTLNELEDWICCGATAAEPQGYYLSLALAAVNLSIAEKAGGENILAPCSACYLNLKKTSEVLKKDAALLKDVNTIIHEKGHVYNGKIGVRHLLDVLSRDISPEEIKSRVVAPMDGVTVAPYYGCQCLRPFKEFDDPEKPTSMTPVLEALGATVLPWDMGAKCCGASNMNTKSKSAESLVTDILKGAEGADVIVTVCPMCQMNLEAFQKPLSRKAGRDLSISILYLPQLMGLAFGLKEKDVGLNLNLAVTRDFLNKVRMKTNAAA